MEFEFNDDQNQIRSAVANWVQKDYGLVRRQQGINDGGFCRTTLNELGALGLMAITIPTEFGGLGLGPVERMIVMEELGRGLVLEPLQQSFICSALLAEYGDASYRAEILPSLASAETFVVYAHHEAGARYDASYCTATAIAMEPGVYAITGTKSLVPAADFADLYIVSATIGKEVALFLVDKDAHQLAVEPYQTQDGSRAGELILNRTPAALLTTSGVEAVARASAISTTAACAEAIGIMEVTLDATVEYLNTRRQFGVCLSSFQALRHRIADIKIHLELARSMSYYATLNVNSEPKKRDRTIAQAMFQTFQSTRFVGQNAVQLHGGIGMTDEYIISHCFRRLTQLELIHGGSLHNLAKLSELMEDSAGVIL